MTDQHFDDSIRSKLEDHRSKGDADWHAFHKKWKQAQDLKFDSVLAEKLSAHKSKSAASWQLFKDRSDHVASLRSHIHSVKQLELVSMLILLFIFIGVIGNESKSLLDPNTHIDSLIQEKVNLEKLKEEPVVHVSQNAELIQQDAGSKPGEKLQTDKKVLLEERRIINNDLNTSVINKSTDISLVSVAAAMKTNEAKSDLHEAMDAVKEQEGYTNSDPLSEALPRMHSIGTIAGVENLNGLGLIPINRNRSKPLLELSQVSFSIKPLSKARTNYLQFGISFDNNLIHTPADLDYNTYARTTEMYGFSLDALYSFKIESLEFESGLAYSSFNKPWNFSMQYGNSSGWFSFLMTNIHYDMIRLPLNVRKHFIENVDWSIYGSLGISNEFILASDYEIASSYLGGGAIPVGSGTDIPEIVESPFEKERYFTQGLLEGESLSEAYYMRIMLGLGIQRNINHSLSLLVGTSYYRSIVNTSIGPNMDRLDKFSINVGIKKRIN